MHEPISPNGQDLPERYIVVGRRGVAGEAR